VSHPLLPASGEAGELMYWAGLGSVFHSQTWSMGQAGLKPTRLSSVWLEASTLKYTAVQPGLSTLVWVSHCAWLESALTTSNALTKPANHPPPRRLLHRNFGIINWEH